MSREKWYGAGLRPTGTIWLEEWDGPKSACLKLDTKLCSALAACSLDLWLFCLVDRATTGDHSYNTRLVTPELQILRQTSEETFKSLKPRKQNLGRTFSASSLSRNQATANHQRASPSDITQRQRSSQSAASGFPWLQPEEETKDQLSIWKQVKRL